MSEYREANLEELTLLLDCLAREYATTNDEYRRAGIAPKISELTARILAVRCRPRHFLMTSRIGTKPQKSPRPASVQITVRQTPSSRVMPQALP
jgi:hypothetical protein